MLLDAHLFSVKAELVEITIIVDFLQEGTTPTNLLEKW